MAKAGTRILIRIGELLAFSLIIGGINLFFHTNPGFLEGVVNPYLILPLVVAAYYGKYYGFLSLLFTVIVVALPLPFAIKLIHPESWDPGYWRQVGQDSLIPLAVSLAGVYLFGIIRDSFTSQIQRLKERLGAVSRNAGLSKRRLRGLETVNRELEERISGQQDSITSLYNHVQELYSLDLAKIMDALLEAVRQFIGATKASIWEYRSDTKTLNLSASIGWGPDEKVETSLSTTETIEGWVFRNNRMFSINQLLQYDNLKKMDTGRNVLTVPISGGDTVWGVLNIREMPFYKYNAYSEKLLQMIVTLAGPALEKAIEYDSVVRQADIHPTTGFPSFARFYTVLEKEVQRMSVQKETMSIVILELVNFQEIVEEYGEEKAYALFVRITEVLSRIAHERARLFHYKAENQVVFLIPHLDYDGASLFCLEVLGAINEENWVIDNVNQPVETALGYAALGEKQLSADEMLEVAENLLDMQKV
jgi:GGDEF domain-containing protein